jgi:hypothetical protein
MNSRILLKSQKNEILNLIRESGLDPVFFSWKKHPSQQSPGNMISRLRYKQTDFFYAFEMKGEVHHAVFSPARQSYIGSDYPVTWTRQKIIFSEWLENLIKEDNEPDMWKTVQGEDEQVGREPTYIVTEPSEKSPDVDQMVSRVNEMIREKPERPSRIIQSTIRRYYGKA